jgi:hypothetical protein
MKADKEQRDDQEMMLAKRRHEELARQQVLRDQAHRMHVAPNLASSVTYTDSLTDRIDYSNKPKFSSNSSNSSNSSSSSNNSNSNSNSRNHSSSNKSMVHPDLRQLALLLPKEYRRYEAKSIFHSNKEYQHPCLRQTPVSHPSK